MILETKRLILRPWEESDAENLFKYAIPVARDWKLSVSLWKSNETPFGGTRAVCSTARVGLLLLIVFCAHGCVFIL